MSSLLTASAKSSISLHRSAKYTGKSARVDEVFKAIGVSSKYRGNWKNRKPVATKNDIKNYEGTAEQNTKLITLAKSGKLKKV